MPVIGEEMAQSLKYRQLRKNTKYKKKWNELYSNELGQLCQGVGKVTDIPNNQYVKGTDTFQVIHYANIPV